MTAMNVVAQPSIDAAFLITDTAVFERGVVVRFEQKTIPILLADGANAAIAVSGIIHAHHFVHFARTMAGASVQVFKEALPAAFKDVERSLLASGKGDLVGHSRMALAVALFEPARGASGYVISNLLNFCSQPGYRPYALTAVGVHLTEFAGRPFPADRDLRLPRHWDPYADGVVLLEAQRADPFGEATAQYVGVGGQGIVTRVDAVGVTHQTIVEWPDKSGQRIHPGAAPRNRFAAVAAKLFSHNPLQGTPNVQWPPR